jgi:hypothetical protein
MPSLPVLRKQQINRFGRMPWWSRTPSRRMMWDIMSTLEGKLVVSSRWLIKIKQDADDNIDKFKARFVARGFS